MPLTPMRRWHAEEVPAGVPAPGPGPDRIGQEGRRRRPRSRRRRPDDLQLAPAGPDRPRRAAGRSERAEKLLRAYYADAIDVAILKHEQARINAEVAEAELQLATEGEQLKQAKEIIDLALDLARDCATSYRRARPDVRKMWNRAFFRTIRVRDGTVTDSTYEEPFATLLGSHKGSMVEVGGVEPPSPGDRSGLLRAQPAVSSRLGAPTGGVPFGQPGSGVRRRPPDGPVSVSLITTPAPGSQANPGGRLPNYLGSERVLSVGACVGATCFAT